MLEYNEGQRKDIKMEEDGDGGQAKDKGRGLTEKDKTVEFVSRQESLNDEKREEPVMDYNGIEIRVIQEDELSVEDEEFHNNWDEEQEEIGEGDDRGGENTEQRVEDNRREDNGVKKDQALSVIREESDVAEFEENNVRVKQEDELIIPDDDDDDVFGADWYKEEENKDPFNENTEQVEMDVKETLGENSMAVDGVDDGDRRPDEEINIRVRDDDDDDDNDDTREDVKGDEDNDDDDDDFCEDESCNRPHEFVFGKYFHCRRITFDCKQCSRIFHLRRTLIRHLEIHFEGEKPHRCSKCNKGFSLKENLIRHGISHAPYKCESCRMRFFKISSLIEHEKPCHEKRPFKCELCNNRFLKEIDLINHVKCKHLRQNESKAKSKKESKSVTYKCATCNSGFTDNEKLAKHVKTRHGPGFECATCHKSYCREGALTRHMKTHLKGPHQCKTCHKWFPDNNSLVQHGISHSIQ